jgi:hypothetical protein
MVGPHPSKMTSFAFSHQNLSVKALDDYRALSTANNCVGHVVIAPTLGLLQPDGTICR